MNSVLFIPTIFQQFSEVSAALTLRDTSKPGNFSMLKGAPDDVIESNQEELCRLLGFEGKRLASPREVHGNGVLELVEDYSFAQRPEGDGLVTDRPGWLIGVTIADCAAILLYDPEHTAISAIHSGWRGTTQNIVQEGVKAMVEHYHSDPKQLWVYICPTPQRFEYEVGLEVAEQFDNRYTSPKGDGKFWLDNKLAVFDQLLAAGVPAAQIEVDPRSAYSPEFHSARRDGDAAGRMVCAIGIKA